MKKWKKPLRPYNSCIDALAIGEKFHFPQIFSDKIFHFPQI